MTREGSGYVQQTTYLNGLMRLFKGVIIYSLVIINNMEKSSQMMIDTSSKKKKKSDGVTDAQKEADRLVQRIINDDEDMEEHVSAM